MSTKYMLPARGVAAIHVQLRERAATLVANVTTGHDWPNTEDELDRLNAARAMREAAARLEWLLTELDQRSDVRDGGDGTQTANAEMSLLADYERRFP